MIGQGVNPLTKALEITTTANQDPLLTHVPIIGVDVWEHAFYLQYLNVKADVSILVVLIVFKARTEHIQLLIQYLNAIWNVINFKEAEARLKAVL